MTKLLTTLTVCTGFMGMGADLPKGGQTQMQGARWSLTLSDIMPKAKAYVVPAVANVTLAWDASLSTNVVTNYVIARGATTHVYTIQFNARTNLTFTFTNLTKGPTYFFGAYATDNQALSSDWSNEATWPGPRRTNFVVTVTPSIPQWSSFVVTNPSIAYLYRSAQAKQGGNKWRMSAQRVSRLGLIWQEWTNVWPIITWTQAPPDVRFQATGEWR